jgi:hypothetical protein
MDLDDLLANSAPRVTERDTFLLEAMREMSVAAEDHVGGGSRRLRRLAVSGLAAFSLVAGVGGVAAATDTLPNWLPWTTSGGTTCDMTITAEARRDAKGELIGSEQDAAEQRAALAAAKDYVATLDLSRIDMTRAKDDWLDYMGRVSVGSPSRETLQQKFVGDDLASHALIHAVDVQMGDYLAAQGYEPRSIMITVANKCGE